MTTGLAAGTYEFFVGIDISAMTAEVSTQRPGAKPSRSFTIDQTPEGFNRLVRTLQATGYVPSRVLVAMEATGSYWMSLATRLVHEGFRVSVITQLPQGERHGRRACTTLPVKVWRRRAGLSGTRPPCFPTPPVFGLVD